MKSRWLWLVCGVVVCSGSAVAEPRILIVGDSWSATVWYGGAIDQVFQEYGRPYVQAEGTLTAVGGTTAADWAKQDHLNIITQQLLLHPTIDAVHLMIGGNDVLGKIRDTNVFTGIYPLLRPGWWQEIQNNIQTVVNHCLLHPQIKHVVIADYDYINRLTIQVFFALLGQTYDFGGMTQEMVNTCFIEVGQLKLAVAQRTPNCHYVQNFGLLQNYYNSPAGAPHPGVYPNYVPYPGGFKAYPMPDAAFDTIMIGTFPFPGDGLHPSVETHKIMIRNAAEQFYLNWYPLGAEGEGVSEGEGSEEGTPSEGSLEEGQVEGMREGEVLEGEGVIEGEGEVNEGGVEGTFPEGEEGETSEGLLEGETPEGEGEVLEGIVEGEAMEGENLEGEGVSSEGEENEGAPEEGEGVALEGNTEGTMEGEWEGCLEFLSTEEPLPVNDLHQTISRLEVPISLTITDVNVAVEITHENADHLVVWVESPAATVVFLATQLATQAAGFPNTTFDDEAATSILLAAAPYAGSYAPVESLLAFDGENAQGTWSLMVYDRESGATGSLRSWRLSFNESCTPPAEGEEGESEGTPAEGEGGETGEGAYEGESPSARHSGDINGDNVITLYELLRIIQFYNSNGFHCDSASEDGYSPGPGPQECAPHSSDYTPRDWRIGLSELLRFIQFYNYGGYVSCNTGEDGFCPGNR